MHMCPEPPGNFREKRNPENAETPAAPPLQPMARLSGRTTSQSHLLSHPGLALLVLSALCLGLGPPCASHALELRGPGNTRAAHAASLPSSIHHPSQARVGPTTAGTRSDVTRGAAPQANDDDNLATMLGAPMKPHFLAASSDSLLTVAAPALSIPRLDMAPTGVVCSPGAGPRCTGPAADGSYCVSSFKDQHGMMFCPKQYFYGYFSVRIKLQAGYTGGINTAFYLIDSVTSSNADPGHSEIDLEFYGARNASRILMATNMFAGGMQNLAQYHVPFDPSKEFHEYSISWSDRQIVWYVDRVPFRVVNRKPNRPWPSRPMQPTVSVWDTSSWTKLKAHYKQGPVNSWFSDFRGFGCVAQTNSTKEGCSTLLTPTLPWNKRLKRSQLEQILKMRKKIFIKEWGWDKAKA